MLLLAVVRSGRLEDESEHQTEDGQRLSEGEAENGDRLQHAASLGLTGDTVDVGGEDQSDADTGADGREAVADDGNVSTNVDGPVHVVLFRSWCPAQHVTVRKSWCGYSWCECISVLVGQGAGDVGGGKQSEDVRLQELDQDLEDGEHERHDVRAAAGDLEA